MLTIDNIENALRNAYLPVIQSQLNNIDPFISSIEKTTKDVYGKEILSVHRESSEETFLLKQDLETIKLDLFFSDKAIKASQSNANALINLVNQEIEDGVSRAEKVIVDAVYGGCGEVEDVPEYFGEKCNYKPLKLNGLKDLFDESKKEYCSANLKPTILETKESYFAIDFDLMAAMVEYHNGDINFMICSPKIKERFLKFKKDQHKDVEVVNFLNGYKCLKFTDNIIMLPYKKMQKNNEIWFVNSRDFKIHELCDWEWLENKDRKILSKNGETGFWKATLIKFMNLVCHNPNNQIKIIFK